MENIICICAQTLDVHMSVFNDKAVLETYCLSNFVSTEMEKKKTAMFVVKGLRHAEVQQTEHDLLGGIRKHLTGDTWR